jgi:hypothetical protein
MMTAGPGAARADAAIQMSSNGASGAARSGKFRREQQTGHSGFAAISLCLSPPHAHWRQIARRLIGQTPTRISADRSR